MANRPAPPLTLREGDREELTRWTRSTTTREDLVLRARIVLAAAAGEANETIAQRLGTSRTTVVKWRGRYQSEGLAGLVDKPRSGRPRHVDQSAIVAATLAPPPEKYGVTHWSTRLLARHLGLGDSTVARTWREYGIRPWREETYRFSTDPQLVAKVTDVVGLYLQPPENAIVLCVNEQSQIQVLDRTALSTALEIATGKVTGARKTRHRHQEFLFFLEKVARAYPERELHLVMDNHATHKKAEVKVWLAKNPRVHVHHTPTSASWLNLVEVWFSIIERQAIHRGTFGSVKDLNGKIRAFITGWNDRCQPFAWIKNPDQIPTKANTEATPNATH